jgi:hypothetical protein
VGTEKQSDAGTGNGFIISSCLGGGGKERRRMGWVVYVERGVG